MILLYKPNISNSRSFLRILGQVILLMLLNSVKLYSTLHPDSPTTIYLFPGQGSDHRIFGKLNICDGYTMVNIRYPVPQRNETMSSYALTLAGQIDTTVPYIIIGVSLGGMISTELSDYLDPHTTIIISSAKSRSEIPCRYRFLKYFRIYKIIPAPLFKIGALIAQPLFEPDRKNEKEIFISMLKAKNPVFLKRSTEMIVNWDHTKNNRNIIHIHGTGDHTLPYRRITANYTIQGGSHMMVLTCADEVNRIINSILDKKEF